METPMNEPIIPIPIGIIVSSAELIVDTNGATNDSVTVKYLIPSVIITPPFTE